MPPTSSSFQLVGLRRDTCGRLGMSIALIWVHVFEYVCICMYICVNVCKCYGNWRVQSTVLDGLQGSFGGPWGVLWGFGGPVGVQGGQGASWEGLGGVREGPGGGLKNLSFIVLEVNLSMV